MSTWIIVDANNVCHRNFHAIGHLSFNNVNTGTLFGFFRDILDLRDLFETDRFVFCFDTKSSKRKDIYPDYKAGRYNPSGFSIKEAKARKDLYKQIDDLLTEYLPNMGFKNIFFKRGYEADDLIASVCANRTPKDKMVVVSTDQDLYQLLSEDGVLIYDPRKKKVITEKSFIGSYGIHPAFWYQVKAIAGCKSDNIMGAKGVGEKTAIRYLQGTLKGTSVAFANIRDMLEIIERNIKLTKLPFPGTGNLILELDYLEEDKWKKVLRDLGMRSLLNRDLVVG